MKTLLRLTRITMICLSTCATAFGQLTPGIWPEGYQEALLDTAIRYELLKPALLNLKKSHEYLSRENESLRQAIRLRDLQTQLLIQHYEALLAGAERRRKRARWLGRAEGFGVGLLVPIP